MRDMKVRGERCDAVGCRNVKAFDVGERKPYGWIQLDAHYVGRGGSPLLDHELQNDKAPTQFFCSKDCVLDELERRLSE